MNAESMKVTGALVGLAVGDALGTTLEFAKRDALPPVTDIVGGGHFGLEPGQWTDDTSMALCLADSLLDSGSFDLGDQLRRYKGWMEDGYFSSTGKCFGIGQQTVRALWEFTRTGDVISPLSKSRGSGNGSLMRLAPVPMAAYTSLKQTYLWAAASSITTHPSLECIEACAVYGTLIAGAIQGWSKEQIISAGKQMASAMKSSELQEVLKGSYLGKERHQISSSGYVVHTLEAALWAFTRTNDFEEGAVLAVNLAQDADTVGAVYGQLAGAYYGFDGIPTHWIECIHQKQTIISMAEQLAELSGQFSVSVESSQYVHAIGEKHMLELKLS